MSLARVLGYARLARNASLQGEELARLQIRRLRSILHHAYENVPYWRSVMDSAGLMPDSVDSLSDLQRLPVTRREDLQIAQGIYAVNVDGTECVVRRTGGSTGRPLAIRTARSDLETEALGWIRTWRRLGLRLGDRQVAIKEPEDTYHEGRARWFQRLGLLRVDHLDLFTPLPELTDAVARLAPDVLRGPPSSISALVEQIRSREDAADIRPRLVFTTGERLSAGTRARISGTLLAPVHDVYGATEAGCIAWRDPQTGRYRVNSDLVIVEVLEGGRPVPPGRSGEVVVTSLFSRAMPILRYSLGDRAVRAHGDPRRPDVPELDDLLGRTVDQIVLEDGRVVSPYQFMPDEIPGIATYRVQQIEPGEVRLLVVPGPQFAEADLRTACRRYERDLDGACRVTYRLLDQLPPESREGNRIVRSESPTGV